MTRTAALVSSLAMALSATAALAQYSGMQVNIAAVESVDDFKRWMQQVPAPQGRYPSALSEVPTGRRVDFPIIVRGLTPPDRGSMTLEADVEFFAPDGRSLFNAPKCCRYTITDRPDVRAAMLSNTATHVLEPGDMGGAYTVRVSVTDGTQTATTLESFSFPGGKQAGGALPSAARELAVPVVPALNQGAQPAKNPGRDGDKRDCLELPTTSEIIKCTERRK
jgi:hypothetical protein